jgi:hypothetical protein
MKKTGKIISVAIFSVAIIAGCSKNDGVLNTQSLKQVVNQSASSLNYAMGKITASQAYSILTISDAGLKSANLTDSIYRVYIPLSLIKGVYDYKPVPMTDRWGFSLVRYFTKSSDDSKMIVNMPLKKVRNPMSLRHFSPADSTLKNNFTISVSDYHNNYNSYWDYDYLLASEITINDTLAGKLNIKSNISPSKGVDYTSQYAFTDSYTAKYRYLSGDTTLSSFGIMKGNNVLYEEKLLLIKNDTTKHHRERQYVLTIGNVQIIRNSASEGVQIAVNGVIQPGATVKIVDNDNDGENGEDHEVSACNKREVQITFEDGTVTTISALIGDSVGNIRTIYTSLHKVYFAASIVDWIAYDIYYHRN